MSAQISSTGRIKWRWKGRRRCRGQGGPLLVNPRGWCRRGGRVGTSVNAGGRVAPRCATDYDVLRCAAGRSDISVAHLNGCRAHNALLEIEVQTAVHRELVFNHLGFKRSYVTPDRWKDNDSMLTSSTLQSKPPCKVSILILRSSRTLLLLSAPMSWPIIVLGVGPQGVGVLGGLGTPLWPVCACACCCCCCWRWWAIKYCNVCCWLLPSAGGLGSLCW